MHTVIVDTNFLMIPYFFKVDIISGIKELVPSAKITIIDKTMAELEHITLISKGEDKKAAEFAKTLLKKYNIPSIHTTDKIRNVDHEILELAKKGEIIVATQDKALKQKLKGKGTPVIYLRQKSFLALSQPLSL